MAELAAREQVTVRRMQILVKGILARRAPSAPAESLALETKRLSEAKGVAYEAMGSGDLEPVDRAVRRVEQMDHCHGFFPGRNARRQGVEPAG
jgi:hypothetical protein